MRLAILDRGHQFGTKVLFAIIRATSRQPVPEALKLVMYRGDFYGSRMGKITHEAMRGSSAWSVADRELMAAFISKMNESAYCIEAHSVVSASAYGDKGKVSAVLADVETAPIDEALRATLRMIGKLTREHSASVDDMRAVLAAGVTRKQIEDALAICFAFATMNRLADAFNFAIGPPEIFESGAKYLLARGYR